MTHWTTELKEENENLKRKLQETEAGLNELIAYVSSSKFEQGEELARYVNVRDIILRVEEIKSLIF